MIQNILNYIGNHLFEIITALIAIYGAILSTINYLKSRGGLKVDFHYYVFQKRFFKWKKEEDKMILSIVNIGGQIETIQNIGFFINKNKVTLINFIDKMIVGKITNFPKKINPSERYTIQFKKKEVVKFLKKNNLTPIYIGVWTTSGKAYKVKFNINKIK